MGNLAAGCGAVPHGCADSVGGIAEPDAGANADVRRDANATGASGVPDPHRRA